MSFARSTTALVGLVLVFAAGCGSDTSGSVATSTPPPAATEAPTTPAPETSGTAAAPGTVAITMKDRAFTPAAVDVKVGATVTWTDIEDVAHNVTATSGATFKSEVFGKGETFSWKATEVGKVDYVCTLHPGMNGTLNVTP